MIRTAAKATCWNVFRRHRLVVVVPSSYRSSLPSERALKLAPAANGAARRSARLVSSCERNESDVADFRNESREMVLRASRSWSWSWSWSWASPDDESEGEGDTLVESAGSAGPLRT